MFYFSSDLHFGHDDTIKSDLRPFKNAKQFDEYVVRLWNKQTTKNDKIYVVGDFVDCDGAGDVAWRETIKIIKKFKAQVFLILGNNEERIVKYFFNDNFEQFKDYCISLGFKDVYKNLILNINAKEFYLTHKPVDFNSKYINLVGHTHAAGGIYLPFGLNVGCDLHHFRLLGEKELSHFLNKKSKYWDYDKSLNMYSSKK